MALNKDDILDFVKRNPIGVGCLGVSLLVGGALYFRWGKLDSTTADRDAKEIQAQTLSKNKDAGEGMKDQLDRLTEDNKSIEARLLVMSRGGNAYLRYFYQLKEDIPELNIIQVTAAPVNTKAALGPMGFTLTVQGTYPQLLTVLRRLEGGSYFSRILSMEVGTAGGSAAAGTLAMRLNLELLGQQ